MPPSSAKKAGEKPTPELHADPEARHFYTRPPLPGGPSLLLVLLFLLLITGGLSFWIYRLQVAQGELQIQLATQTNEMLQQLDWSGLDRQSSFEEVGTSLKAMNDRVEELWQLAGEIQRSQIEAQGQALDEMRSQLEEMRPKVVAMRAELNVLSGLLSEQKDEISGQISSRIQQAGKSAATLEAQQRQTGERVVEMEQLLQQHEAAVQSVASYRRTTNQALLRLEARLTLLEKRVAGGAELGGEEGFPFLQ